MRTRALLAFAALALASCASTRDAALRPPPGARPSTPLTGAADTPARDEGAASDAALDALPDAALAAPAGDDDAIGLPADALCARERSRAHDALGRGWDEDELGRVDRVLSQVSGCVAGVHRAWVLAVLSATPTRGCDGADVDGELRAYEHGVVVARRRMRWRLGGCMARVVNVMRLAALDADPREELALQIEEPIEAQFSVTRWTVFTVEGAQVRAYPGTADRFIVDVADSDRDGLSDLIAGDPYAPRVPACEGGASVLQGPRNLLHARPDGALVDDDAVALEFLRSECPRAPRCLLQGAHGCARSWDDLNFARTQREVACANAYGWTEARVRRALRAMCTTFEDRCERGDAVRTYTRGTCPEYILDMARQTPPVPLSRRSDAE